MVARPAHSASVAAQARPHRKLLVAALIAAMVVVLSSLVGSGTALAHTGFESSTPADGSVTDELVDVVTVVFTGEATPIGDQFVALTAEGVVQQPVSIETADNMTFTLRFDPPLAGGQIGLRWNVQAADSHPIEGSFSFTVTAAPSTTTPPTTAPTTTAPPATAGPETTIGSTIVAAEVAEALPATTSTSVAVAAVLNDQESAGPVDGQGAVADAPIALDEFLAVDNSRPGETTATIGRVVGLLGVTLGLGGLAFVAAALRGRRDEVGRALRRVQLLGGVIVVGAAIEYVGVGRIAGDSLTSTWSTSAGFATVLRILGGLALLVALGGTIVRSEPKRAASSLSAAVVDDLGRDVSRRDPAELAARWTPNTRSWPAAAGVVMILASFWFDGHTVSKGFRPLHAVVNTVHVAAGAVWVGGVVALATVAWTRSRSGDSARVGELVVRFSKIATIALLAVVAAGGVMAFLVLDSFGELTGTPWGKILLLKTAAVGVAIVIGAYNHFRLLPALESEPDSPELLVRLRSAVTAEAIMLVFVVTVTAWLVAAAS